MPEYCGEVMYDWALLSKPLPFPSRSMVSHAAIALCLDQWRERGGKIQYHDEVYHMCPGFPLGFYRRTLSPGTMVSTAYITLYVGRKQAPC